MMSTEKPIRVMIVDDHKVVRSGLSAFLMAYDDLELVAEADSGEKALAFCHKYHPDVILMDLVMPKMNGAEATEAILKHDPNAKVIALTSFKEQSFGRKCTAGWRNWLPAEKCRCRRPGAGHPASLCRAAHAGSGERPKS